MKLIVGMEYIITVPEYSLIVSSPMLLKRAVYEGESTYAYGSSFYAIGSYSVTIFDLSGRVKYYI